MTCPKTQSRRERTRVTPLLSLQGPVLTSLHPAVVTASSVAPCFFSFSIWQSGHESDHTTALSSHLQTPHFLGTQSELLGQSPLKLSQTSPSGLFCLPQTCPLRITPGPPFARTPRPLSCVAYIAMSFFPFLARILLPIHPSRST